MAPGTSEVWEDDATMPRLYHRKPLRVSRRARSECGTQSWRWARFLFIVLAIVLVVVLDLFGLWQPGIDYEDEDENEDDRADPTVFRPSGYPLRQRRP
jgi:hypothetical protein